MKFSDEEQKILESAKEDKQINIPRAKTLAILICILGFFMVGLGFSRIFSNPADGLVDIGMGTIYGTFYWQNYENLKFRQNVYSLLRKLSAKGDRNKVNSKR